MALSWMSRLLKNLSRPVSRSGPSPARPRVEALEGREVPAVSFFGGNVLPHVQAQALFLGGEFSSTPASTETATLDASLKDVTSGPYLQALTRVIPRVVALVAARDPHASAHISTLQQME